MKTRLGCCGRLAALAACLVLAGCGGGRTIEDVGDGVGTLDPATEAAQDDVTGTHDGLDTWLDGGVDTRAGELTTRDPGAGEPDVWTGCTPNCQLDDECGDDGCGGSCGTCAPDRECRFTRIGNRCSLGCVDTGDCWAGALCLFGDCVDHQCVVDDDCGPDQVCSDDLRCHDRLSCAANADCPHGVVPHYCDDTGHCRQGNCRDEADCGQGACGPDHWCVPDDCYGDPTYPCPASQPVCHLTVDRSCLNDPACNEGKCGLPCVRDADCEPGQACYDWMCLTRTGDCQLDAQCPAGQYCHPWCNWPPDPCGPDGACPAGSACVGAYCQPGADQNPPCATDAECLTVVEDGVCDHGRCQVRTQCLWDTDCGAGLHCWGGLCLPLPTPVRCLVDADCPPDLICQQYGPGDGCVPVPDGQCLYDVQCGPDQACGPDQRCYPSAGLCAFVEPGPGFCDDGNPATVDGCEPQVGCTHVAQNP